MTRAGRSVCDFQFGNDFLRFFRRPAAQPICFCLVKVLFVSNNRLDGHYENAEFIELLDEVLVDYVADYHRNYPAS